MNTPKFCYELESRVLETLMDLESPTEYRIQQAMLKLKPKCFYKPENVEIFGLIRKAFDESRTFGFVDILIECSVNTDLHEHMVKIMSDFREYHASNVHFECDIDKLLTLANLRKQLSLNSQIITAVDECTDPIEAQNILADGLRDMASLTLIESKHGISNDEIAADYLDGKIAEDMKLPTTSKQLNDLLAGGIMPKSLIIVAAGASVGKTGFSIWLLDAIARNQPDRESLFFSIEMEYKHIWMRHVGICAGKTFDKLTEEERTRAVRKSMQVPMKIYDAAICRQVADIDFILNTSRLRALQRPISVIVVDYLGLVQSNGKFDSNYLKHEYVTSRLAELAIQLNCTVIALSQINRGAANRSNDDRCPWPHDAADSSGGHRSSSLWLGVDRPELYQDDPCYRGQFVVKARKNRFGNTFDWLLDFKDGAFGEVPPGWFKQSSIKPQNREQALFSPNGDD